MVSSDPICPTAPVTSIFFISFFITFSLSLQVHHDIQTSASGQFNYVIIITQGELKM
jgi:hypothetical protein